MGSTGRLVGLTLSNPVGIIGASRQLHFESFEMKTWDDISIGDCFGPRSYRISEEVAERFCDVTRAKHPWYRSDSPYGGRLVPSTLPSSDDFPLMGTEIDTGVQAKHSMRLYRPYRVGEEATVEGVVVDKYIRRGYKYLVFQYTLRDSAGQLLCVNTMTTALPPEED